LCPRRLLAVRGHVQGRAAAYCVGIENLAPDIVRQRPLIEGIYTIDVDESAITRYFDEVTTALALRTYGGPTIFAPRGEGSEENEDLLG